MCNLTLSDALGTKRKATRRKREDRPHGKSAGQRALELTIALIPSVRLPDGPALYAHLCGTSLTYWDVVVIDQRRKGVRLMIVFDRTKMRAARYGDLRTGTHGMRLPYAIHLPRDHHPAVTPLTIRARTFFQFGESINYNLPPRPESTWRWNGERVTRTHSSINRSSMADSLKASW
ncbi:pyridoxine 5'-phosphate synthase [Anopheles sinensis]|uniref:Pyridoxine 5'-phosphate synthase n=1 Tax=Anopheles sinensis TaxID=74873 RepID=A0A084W4N4_ANOSI|nr:pyridoxine 5'-phosphate synthase [Anopheles sinensis]